MKYTAEELASIKELKEAFKVSSSSSSMQKFESLVIEAVSKANGDDEDLALLRSILSKEQMLEVVERADGDSKEIEIIVDDEVEDEESLTFNYLGVFTSPPKKANKNELYRNSTQGVVYIYTDRWVEFLRDGKSESVHIGGGVGADDVMQMIAEYGGSGHFDGTIQSTNVIISETNFATLKGTDLQAVLTSVDNVISSKILFGEYLTRDMEESGDIIYVGFESASGGWYIKKVVSDVDGNLSLLYTNNYANGTEYNYMEAWGNKYTLNYVSISSLGVV